jgi:hypothetical protein
VEVVLDRRVDHVRATLVAEVLELLGETLGESR